MKPSSTMRKPSRSNASRCSLVQSSINLQLFYHPPLFVVQPGWLSRGRVLGGVSGMCRRGDHAGHPQVGEDPLQERGGPGGDADALEALRARAGEKAALRERPHDDHAQAELLSERKDRPLDVALQGVVGHLDRVDPPTSHHSFELLEGGALVVRRAEEAHAVLLLFVLEPREVLLPGDEVVHLLEVHTAPEVVELRLELEASLLLRGRPDLRRDEDVVPVAVDRLAEDLFGAAVHRRRVEDARSAGIRSIDDLVGDLLALGPEVEGEPGAEADNGDLDPGDSKASALHTMGGHARDESSRSARAGGRAHRRSGERRELPGRLDARAAARAAAPAGDLRLRPARGQPRRRGAWRPHGTPRRAGARAGRPASHRDHAPPARDDRRLRAPTRPFSAPDRGEPDRPAQDPLRHLGGGAGVLHLLGRSGGPPRSRRLPTRGTRRASATERLDLHGPPARQLPPGPAPRPGARPRLPPPERPRAVRRRGRRPRGAHHRRDRRASPLRRGSRAEPPRSRVTARQGTRRPFGDVRGALCTRRPCCPRRARACGVGRVHQPSGSDEVDVCPPRIPGALLAVKAEQAYAETNRITRETARNFAWGIRVLPGPKRRAIAALYAFARRVDDLADRERPARAELELWEAAIEALPSSHNGRSILVALADSMVRYDIPKQALLDLVRGALMDCDRSSYSSWDELREYCRRVAGAVGVACAAVYGPSSWEAARPRAQTLGLALQQINIMRDVAEDWSLGRVYLPQEELSRFGVTEDEIASGRPGSGWRPLMEHQAVRADALMRKGLELLPLLDRRSALCVRSFAGIYRGLLMQMRARDYDVFSEPPHLSTVEKLKAVAAL